MKRLEVIAAMQKVFSDQRYSPRTAECYIDWFNRFWRFSEGCRDLDLGQRVGRFLNGFNNRSVATQHQALCALAFVCNQALDRRVDFGEFARAQVPKRLPVWMTQDEIPRLFQQMRGHKDISTTMIYLHCVAGFAAGVRSPLDTLGGKVVPFTPPLPARIAAQSATA